MQNILQHGNLELFQDIVFTKLWTESFNWRLLRHLNQLTYDKGFRQENCSGLS